MEVSPAKSLILSATIHGGSYFFIQPEKQIGLNDAAEFINRNSSYISRLLKKELSMGFSQLLTERRMEAAKDLLAHTTMKVSDISEKVGYTSTKYFNQVFYANFQMTPTDYRFIMKQL